MGWTFRNTPPAGAGAFDGLQALISLGAPGRSISGQEPGALRGWINSNYRKIQTKEEEEIMANLLTSGKTSLQNEDVISRAVQFFSTTKWTCQSQSDKIATFQGKPPIPWFLILVTIFGFIFFIVPGVIMYIFIIRKMYKFQNLVVTTKGTEYGTEVDINYPNYAKKLVSRFMDSLPAYEVEELASAAAGHPAEA